MSTAVINLIRKTSSRNRPGQVAVAIALGVICGISPKLNLLFPLLLLILYVLPIHLTAALSTAAITTCLAPMLSPVAGKVGIWVLTNRDISAFINFLDGYPLVPWLALHNTVVIGSLAIGTAASIPIYSVTMRLFEAIDFDRQTTSCGAIADQALTAHAESEPLTARLINQESNSSDRSTAYTVEPQPLAASMQIPPALELIEEDDTENAAQQTEPAQQAEPQSRTSDTAIARFDEPSEPTRSGRNTPKKGEAAAIDSIHALEDLLERISEDRNERLDAEEILQRATRAAELVDDILASLEGEVGAPITAPATTDRQDSAAESSSVNPSHINRDIDSIVRIEATHPAITKPTEPASGDELVQLSASSTELAPNPPRVHFKDHDTTISIMRLGRVSQPTEITTTSSKDTSLSAPIVASSAGNPTPVNARVDDSTGGLNSASLNSPATIRSAVLNREDLPGSEPSHHEEALRHLLQHLRAFKEKV